MQANFRKVIKSTAKTIMNEKIKTVMKMQIKKKLKFTFLQARE
jgi:hypothetical protein